MKHEIKIKNPFIPAVIIDGREFTPDTVPGNEKEKEIVEVLKEASEHAPFGRSVSLFEMQLFLILKEILEN